MTTNLKSLIGKLTPATRRALESAANARQCDTPNQFRSGY